MKLFIGLGIGGFLMASASAQEFVVSQHREQIPVVREPTVQRPQVGGIVNEVFNVQKPWQLVNPLAPKEYGDGRQNVASSEKDPGKPKGFILFAVEW